MAAPHLPPKPGAYAAAAAPREADEYYASPHAQQRSPHGYAPSYAQRPLPQAYQPPPSQGYDARASLEQPTDARAPRLPSQCYSPGLGGLDSLMSDLQTHLSFSSAPPAAPAEAGDWQQQGSAERQQQAAYHALSSRPPLPPHPSALATHQQPSTDAEYDAWHDASRPISSASAIINLYTSDSPLVGHAAGAPWNQAPAPQSPHSHAVPGYEQHETQHPARAARPLPPPPAAPSGFYHREAAAAEGAAPARAPSLPRTPQQSGNAWPASPHTPADAHSGGSGSGGHLHTISSDSTGIGATPPSWSPEVSSFRIRGVREGSAPLSATSEYGTRDDLYGGMATSDSAGSMGALGRAQVGASAAAAGWSHSNDSGMHQQGSSWELSGPEQRSGELSPVQYARATSPHAASNGSASAAALANRRLPPTPASPAPSRGPVEAAALQMQGRATSPKLASLMTGSSRPEAQWNLSFDTPASAAAASPNRFVSSPAPQSPSAYYAAARSESAHRGSSSQQGSDATGSGASRANSSTRPSTLAPLRTPSTAGTSGPSSGGMSAMSATTRMGRASSYSSYAMGPMTPLLVQTHDGTAPDFALLSTIAVLLRDAVPRGKQIKGSVAYPFSFTGRDVVSTIQALIPREHAAWAAGLALGQLDAARERRVALLVAKTLKSQLFFHEVDWGQNDLRDGVEEVYMFLEDSLAGSGTPAARQESENAFDRELALAHETGQKSGTRAGQQARADGMDELPTGVFTPLTACYSPLCGKPDAPRGSECYSLSCPRARSSAIGQRLTSQPLADAVALPPAGELSRWGQPMQAAHSGAAGKSHMAAAWADLVPPDLLKSIPKKEIKRQNAILETIQKEEEFLSDLELLETLFLHRLEKPSDAGDPPPIPIGPERDIFVGEVFSNHRELVGHIRRLVERLHVRQREQSPIVQSIGDIFLDAALEWGGAFDANMTNFPLAKNRIQREASVNPRFVAFLESCRRDPACHRLPMDHFLQRATTRLPRYKLHFKSILEDTDASNADTQSLVRAMEIVDEQCRAIQKGVAEAEVRVKIREYAYNLATKRNKSVVDMDLLNPERQLVHQGRVYRKPAFQELEWADLLAVLFDNFLVVTRTKKRDEDGGGGGESSASSSKFLLVKRPIPVEMMELSGFNEPSVSRSLGLSNFHLRNTSERESRDLWPFTVHHIGGKTEPLTLFCPSKAARNDWRRKLEEAQGLRAAVQEANKVFDSHTVSDDVFALPSASSIDPERPPPGLDNGSFHGRVTCAVPFVTADGRRLVAIGCADGVWIGLRHDPRSLRKVLHLKLVTQCAVLESFGIFVVLADKVLISYSLEALVPSAGATSTPRPPQKLSGNRDVVFFSVGQLKERTLLVYMKKKANESVFRALEPVINAPHAEQHKGGGGLLGRFARDNKSSDWFRIYKTFFIPSEAYSMQFLRSKLCIVCARGFEIMNLDSLLPGTIPDFSQCARDDPRVQMLAGRVERSKPLGMFKNSESEFLLCYDAFACYVDRLGEPVRLDNVIEWEGTPHSVAFRAPYVLAFDTRFVEIRDSASGQLVQLIRANDLRYVSGSTTQPNENEASIILSQRKRAAGRLPYDFQHVFELVTTIPTQLMRADTTHTTRTYGSGNSRNSSVQGWF